MKEPAVPAVLAVIQARMSSSRFPGKVLAPFLGEPILARVVRTVREALPAAPLVLATSSEASDDPLAAYAECLGLDVVRGPLYDVCARFQLCANRFPADWVLRICADSPLLPPSVVRQVVAGRDERADVITTTQPRTFPKGCNAELLRRDKLLALAGEALDPADREHVTRWFYRHPQRYVIRNVSSADPSLAALDLAVDTVEDLRRLEAMAPSPGLQRLERQEMRS